jgi:glyoxylase-like metal-dependent hydrolase (beta-lactamase superfamily II)
MKRRFLFLALSCLLAAAVPALAQRDLSKVVLRPEKVAEGVWMLTGAGGNIGVCAGTDGVFQVDAQYGPLVPRIRAIVDSLSGGRPVRFVLNTHYHGDHVDGDSAMAAAGAIIVAHGNVRRRMSVEQHNTAFDVTIPPAPAQALPVVTFEDSLDFHLAGQEIHVFHVPPAHTDGDAVVRMLPADVVHMGDLFFNGTYPVIDVSAGGSIGGMIRAVDRILPLIGSGTRVIPGHGPLGDRAALLRYRAMLVTVRDRVTPLVRQGRTLEQIQNLKVTADLDSTWGGGFMKPDRFLKVVYQDLSRGARTK